MYWLVVLVQRSSGIISQLFSLATNSTLNSFPYVCISKPSSTFSATTSQLGFFVAFFSIFFFCLSLSRTTQVFMISYMVDGQGFLIISREVVSEDVEVRNRCKQRTNVGGGGG